MGSVQAERRPLLVVVGPTGVGKTAFSLLLAAHRPITVISADSRLFYRGMDIGTAKPSPTERAAVPHRLIDICAPDKTIALGVYKDLALAAIDEAHRSERLPVLVGGTGQYVRAVVEGWGIPRVPPQPRLREALAALGGEELGRWLTRLDPQAASALDLRNVRRVIRALEVTLVSGRPLSALQKKVPPPYDILQLGLTMARKPLYARIDDRVDRMITAGLVAEVTRLRDAGYGPRLPAMSGLGYRQLWSYLAGEATLEEAVARIKFETHRFVRRQNNWFSQDDGAICWFDVTDDGYPASALACVSRWRGAAAS